MRLLLCFLFLSLLKNGLSGGNMSSAISPEGVEQLKAMAASIHGLKPDQNWGTPNPCDWYGLKCGAPQGKSGHLLEMNLKQANLSGILPALIFSYFPYIQKIDLSENAFTGPLPFLNQNVSYLEFVYLGDGNKFTGDASDVFKIPLLKEVDLSNTRLAGTLPSNIGSVTKGLSVVTCANADLTGVLPASFWSISSLRIVDFSNCSFSGFIDNAVKNTSNITILNLSNNRMSGTIPNFHDDAFTDDHSSIFIEGNSFASIPPQFFARGVSVLQASNNAITGTLPDMSNATSLEFLYLDHNQMSGAVPESISACEALEVLQLDSNYLSSLPENFGTGLTNVKNMLLFTNAFNCEMPFTTMCGMAKLQQLQIQNNGYLRGSLPSCIDSWKSLDTLIIEQTAVGGVIPEELFELNLLEILILSQSFFNGSIPDLFTQLPQLKTVTIESRHIGNSIIEPAISGHIPASLFKLDHLESLTLQFNMLTGTIPASEPASPNIYQLLLNNNLLEGSVPGSLLSYMNKPLPAKYEGTPRIYTWNYNRLTGTVPDLSKVAGFSKLLINNNPFSGYVDPAVYDKDYAWLNSTGSPDQRNIRATFFTGMRLLTPVQPFAQAMGAVGVPFYLSGAMSVNGQQKKPTIINRLAQDRLAIKAGYRVDVPNNMSPSKSGINVMMCVSDSIATCGTPPTANWTLLETVNHPIIQNVTYPQTVGDVSFTIPTNTMKNSLGNTFFVIVFNGNSYNRTGIIDISYGPKPFSVIYDPSPVLQSSTPETSRKWGCQKINITGENFADTGPNLYCIFKDGGNEFAGPATFYDSEHIGCEVPELEDQQSYPLREYEIYVTPNNGSTLSTFGPNGSLTIQFKDDCPLSPAITSLPRGFNCECGMCECTSAGACYFNKTTESMACDCDLGFEGENCELCSYVCGVFSLFFFFKNLPGNTPFQTHTSKNRIFTV
eukprot:TRINITY_DN1120_c2_g1_i2.p1 TRINITY_DN1120_c2_g1~~TRINITY_DN1120_c2_g1_i2.p1  ORF type:complete len:966 (+),score=110.32 TRINITY_DN1120_c2_g1_i2:62-2899(+)